MAAINIYRRHDFYEFLLYTFKIGFEYKDANGQVSRYYYRKDIRGDIINILDNNGNVVVKYVYDAWGNHKVLDAAGTENTSDDFIGNINPIRYRGYYYDTETNLYYLISRYYDPETGRFISPDHISALNPEVLNGLNLYAYCCNNPIKYVDVYGNVPIVNYILRTQILYFNNKLMDFGLYSTLLGNITVGGVKRNQNQEAGIFYAFSDMTVFDEKNSSLLGTTHSIGLGINAGGWFGLEVGLNANKSQGDFNVSVGLSVTPWFNMSVQVGTSGLGIDFEIGNGEDAFVLSVRIGPFMLFYLLAAILRIQIQFRRNNVLCGGSYA